MRAHEYARVAYAAQTDWLSDDSFMYLGMNCYPFYWRADTYTTCNTAMSFDGEVDDIGVFARVMDDNQANVDRCTDEHNGTSGNQPGVAR